MHAARITLFENDLFDLNRNYERLDQIGMSLDEKIERLAKANRIRS
jgi:pilus assembly protein TadC